MKKVISGLTATVLTLLGLVALSFASMAPANAGTGGVNQVICHFDNGNGGKYTQIPASEHSIVKKTDALAGHGKHADDIIPPFEYNFGGNDHGTYPGQNWGDAEQVLWKNQCNPAGNPLTPVVPADIQATCVDTTPVLNIPAQPFGVTLTSELKNNSYILTYAKPADTPYNTFWFTEGFSNPVTVKIIPAGPGDLYWDDAKGACNLPDTGAGAGIQWWMIPAAGGLFLLAALLFTVNTVIGHRKN